MMLHFLTVLTYTLSTRAYYPYYVLSVWGPRAGIILFYQNCLFIPQTALALEGLLLVFYSVDLSHFGLISIKP